jgi:anti-sigma factor RsiW
MNSISFRDVELLCAYLDGELSDSKRKHLEARIHSEPALAAKLDEICETCKLLHSMPKRRAPRNFTLTPRMAGVRAPVPRLVPAFSWASAVAMLLFVFTLGTSLLGKLSFGTAAPMLAAAPSGGVGGGPPAAATEAPVMMAAPENAEPAPLRESDPAMQTTPTVEVFLMAVPEATQLPVAKDSQAETAREARQKPLSPWLFIWPGLGVLLGLSALLVRWANQRAFQKKNRRG